MVRGRERLKPDVCPRNPSGEDRLPDRASPYFWRGPLDRKLVNVQDADFAVDHQWSIWPSSENWHLYYKLRQSYGDLRLLHEAPGHLFLEHESDDLASFLQIAMLNGWGGYILTQADYVTRSVTTSTSISLPSSMTIF